MRFAPWATFVLVFAAPAVARAATYYVAPTGSDTAAGTLSAPFASWAHAESVAAAGDTVYFRGGTYKYTDATSTCSSPTATINAVVLSKSGTSGNPIRYWAYSGEKPVFDFSGIADMTKYSCRQVGVRVQADWLYLKGLELKGTLQLNNQNHESWCVYVIGGNNNLFELLDAHHNMGPGFFIQTGGNNTFLNCDSHENEDTLTSNGDGQSADGFGCHPNKAGNTGNRFIGCRAWWNSDDAWDFINAQEACTVEYSWAWYSGYKPDAISGGQPVSLSSGNGNGFKGGGYGDPQTGVPATPPQHVIQQSCAFYNKANGLYANHGIVNPYFYNNTSFNNGTDVNMLGLDGTTVTSVGFLRNNLAYSNSGHGVLSNMTNMGPISDMFNSWDTSLGLTVTDADFQSVAFPAPASCPQAYTPGGTPCVSPTDMTTFGGMASARQADGSLPNVPFLRLAATSHLIDKGTNVGLPYAGSEPDLGCFETGLTFDPSDGGTLGDGGSFPPPDSGTSSSGGSSGSSGASTSSGSSGSGGGSSSGGAGGSSGSPGASSGMSGSGGSADAGEGPPNNGDAGGSNGHTAGCGCQTVGTPSSGASIGLLLGALAGARRRRRSRF
jgi:MYXO-CTERM domain-containing protein